MNLRSVFKAIFGPSRYSVYVQVGLTQELKLVNNQRSLIGLLWWLLRWYSLNGRGVQVMRNGALAELIAESESLTEATQRYSNEGSPA